jgi:GDSL-like Lipase/Acylhydrolase family
LEFLGYGDSKTYADDYQPILETLLFASTKFASHTNLAAEGRSTADGAAAIDAELAGSSANPGHILYNLGASDVLSLPAEVDWKANTSYILSAMHTKWPGASIYMMRPWRRTAGAACNTLAGWIADIVAINSFCSLGPDERIFLENGDDGVTYTSDGVHPNAAGYSLVASEWLNVLVY